MNLSCKNVHIYPDKVLADKMKISKSKFLDQCLQNKAFETVYYKKCAITIL